MRIAVICLAYGREHLTAKSLAKNLPNAGEEFSLFIINRKGIAKAMNDGLHAAKDSYDTFCFLGNDIIEPYGWLHRRIQSISEVKDRFGYNAGMIAYPIGKIYPDYSFEDVVANVLITKNVFDKVGYFNNSMGDYAPIDCDYNHRVTLGGFKNYYLPLFQAIELDEELKEKTDNIYGYSKAAAISASWTIHSQQVSEYISGTRPIYLPYEQH